MGTVEMLRYWLKSINMYLKDDQVLGVKVTTKSVYFIFYKKNDLKYSHHRHTENTVKGQKC